MNKDGYKDSTAETAIRNVAKEEERRRKEMDNFGKCRKCGKRIVFIRMKSGKAMPCDPIVRRYTLGGNERVVTTRGEVVAATFSDDADEGDGVGYVSHFATCPYADTFRNR